MINYTWTRKTCSGMDLVERISFELTGTDGVETAKRIAVYVIPEHDQKERSEYSVQDIIDIGERIRMSHNWDQLIADEIAQKVAGTFVDSMFPPRP